MYCESVLTCMLKQYSYKAVLKPVLPLNLTLNHFPEVPLELTQPLTDQTVPETATITLQCATSKPTERAIWFKNGVEVVPDQKHQVESDGIQHSLTLVDVSPEEATEYMCQIGDLATKANIVVEGVFLPNYVFIYEILFNDYRF